MSTTTVAIPRRSQAARQVGVPFARLVRVEMRKLVDTRGGRTLLGVIGFVTAGVIALALFTAPPADLTFATLAFAAAFAQALLLPVLGILTATNEWSQRTALVTFTLEPRRLRVAGAKLAAALLVGLLAVVAALAIGALANVAGMLWLDGDGSWTIRGTVLGGATLAQLIAVVQGVAFGMALLNSAAAIVCLFALPTIWSMVGLFVSGLQPVAPWLDLWSATTPLTEGTMHGGDWLRLGTAAAVWLLLPLLFGLWRTARREVK